MRRVFLTMARASVVAQAKPTTMFASLPCKDPFVDAAATNDISREPDPHAPEQLLTTKYTKVVVALDAAGAVTDAWTCSPSASPDFDKSALELARKGSYKAAVSACKSVPSVLLFTVTSLQ
jgi:outer membrane biosynthesis protein TonB